MSQFFSSGGQCIGALASSSVLPMYIRDWFPLGWTGWNRWGNNGNNDRLYFFGSKLTADGDWSHEIRRRLLPGRKAMTILDSILKSRDITLQTKIHIVKDVVFPLVMYRCESWTIYRKLSTEELMLLNCWRRLLRVPWTARKSNQFILKETGP